MTMELIGIDEVKAGRGTGSNGEKYAKYAVAIAPHVNWLKEQIDASETGLIRVRSKDVAATMGEDFVKRNATSIYWGLKYSLFQKGIVVDTGTLKTGDKLLAMRYAKEGDKLPPSLTKKAEAKVEKTE